MTDNYCKKCGEKIRSKIAMKGGAKQELCGLCMDDELNAQRILTSQRLNPPSGLPWTERLPMLSINPDAATRHDVARMVAELMECRKCLSDMARFFAELNSQK